MEDMNITSAQYEAVQDPNVGIKATIDGVEMSALSTGNRLDNHAPVAAGTLTIQDADSLYRRRPM